MRTRQLEWSRKRACLWTARSRSPDRGTDGIWKAYIREWQCRNFDTSRPVLGDIFSSFPFLLPTFFFRNPCFEACESPFSRDSGVRVNGLPLFQPGCQEQGNGFQCIQSLPHDIAPSLRENLHVILSEGAMVIFDGRGKRRVWRDVFQTASNGRSERFDQSHRPRPPGLFRGDLKEPRKGQCRWQPAPALPGTCPNQATSDDRCGAVGTGPPNPRCCGILGSCSGGVVG